MPEAVGKSKVVVRSGNVFEKPLLDTGNAKTIEIYDGFGELVALFSRVFNDEMWSFSTKSDADWHAVCVRNGIVAPETGVRNLMTP